MPDIQPESIMNATTKPNETTLDPEALIELDVSELACVAGGASYGIPGGDWRGGIGSLGG
jgi:hypothetical protein